MEKSFDNIYIKKHYEDQLLVKDALQIYFSHYHFKDGGYKDKWFKIKIGPFFLPLPNIKDRVDAVKIHDIHHVITEYRADYKGEVQIGAWEIASGCGKYYIAWLLNFGSFVIGIFFFPKHLFQAFMEGRSCRTNLYHACAYDEKLLNKTVGELRELVGAPQKRNKTTKDYLYFILYCVTSLIYPLAGAAFTYVIYYCL